MKRKIAILLMTGICLMNTVPCFASQSSMVSVSNSEEAQYTTLPDADTLQKDVGFRPKAPETLAGGYQFNSGHITELFDLDTNGAQINKHKGIDFQYLKRTIIPPNRFPCLPNRHQGNLFQKILLL